MGEHLAGSQKVVGSSPIASTMLIDESVARRFYAKVERKSNDCWEWIGATTVQGYGRIRIDGKLYGANRVSVVMHHGIDPTGLDVCHTRDNPKCVRPSHLFVGSRSDNVQDCLEKGRFVAARKGKFVLHPSQLNQVIDMVNRGGLKGAGRELGVSFTMVGEYLARHNVKRTYKNGAKAQILIPIV